ncbi:uncharacterized protein LOC111115002 isoform X1 [Crassostrea virginica]|uniref:Uncharacterized protein LOC111115002 isoform X1 n=2 Tax=Crassostrea virginica TaxID=6565 RepID=A0A8B8C0V3_CRAVI|nr:uncharacterized protein LOC111115002 isoform X1 [Crassostrea virginica]
MSTSISCEPMLKVMCQKSLGLVYAFSIFSLVVTSVFPQPATTILCERRCESSTPNLGRLKLLWHRMSKRIGKDDMSFAAFVQSLIAASERYSRLESVGNYLITMIDRYQDCVKACEHQHSKRAEERTTDSFIRKQICISKGLCL